jgi:hypothetical protein
VLLNTKLVGQTETQPLFRDVSFIQIAGHADPIQVIQGVVTCAEISVPIVDPAD